MEQKVYSQSNTQLSPFMQIDGVETIWLKKVPDSRSKLLDLFSLLTETP
jgi:hypothetical protein